MKLKPEFINNQIFHPASGQLLNINLIEPAEYEYLYNNGYKHLFEDEKIEEKPKKNVIPKQ